MNIIWISIKSKLIDDIYKYYKFIESVYNYYKCNMRVEHNWNIILKWIEILMNN